MSARPWLPACFAALGFSALAAASWGFTVDDAFVVARFARNLVAGRGWAMNPDSPVDGITGPLWILPGALAQALGASPVLAAKLLGAWLAALAVAMTVRALSRRSDRRSAWVGGAVLIVGVPLAVWSVGGLETGAAALCVAVLTRFALLREGGGPVGRAAALVVLLALPALRPELSVFALVLAIGTRPKYGVALAAGVATVTAWRFAAFGSAIPLAYLAKQGDVGSGVEYVVRATTWTTGLGGVVLCVLAAREGRRGARPLAFALTAHLAAVALSGGDWMPGFRLLAPVLPAYAVLVAWGVSAAWRGGRSTRGLGAVALAVALVVPLMNAVAVLPEVRASALPRQGVGRDLAERLRDIRGSVALVDVGYLGWASGVEVVDLGGITDETIARSRGGHLSKEVSLAYLDQRAPGALVLHSRSRPVVEGARLRGLDGYPVEMRIAASPWLQTHFEVAEVLQYSDRYWYVLLVRRR